jgi:polyketide biosynthesis enoyl-CoA hydratase PksH
MSHRAPGPLGLEVEGAVARFTLRRGGVDHRLDRAGVVALQRTLDVVDSRRDVRVLVIDHVGEWFCSGMDLAEIGDVDAGTRRFFEVLQRLADGDVVTIAAVDGRAYGGGVGLVAACDVVLASPEATFALPEALWGLLPAAVLPFLSRRVGAGPARQMALTTRTVDAEHAARIGLVDEIVDPLRRAVATTARRAACVERSITRQIKDYAATLAQGRVSPADAAAALERAVTVPGVRQGIDRWTRTGRLPWE